MQRGRVYFWKRDFNNPKNQLFGWGFIMPEGCKGAYQRVYFNETRLPDGVEVKSGDHVEFTLFKPNGKYTSLSARTVTKIDDGHDDDDREEITTILGEFNVA